MGLTKFLVRSAPGALVQNADRLQRFEQEARVLGTLNHIFDVGNVDGLQHLVSEPRWRGNGKKCSTWAHTKKFPG